MKLLHPGTTAIASAVFSLAIAAAPAAAQELSEAELIYQELATLPPEERERRLIEGATQEQGPLEVISTLRGQLTRDQAAMFQAKYPFVEVNVTEMGSQDAAERLYTEEAVGRHLTDVVGLGTPDLEQLLARDFLARYPTPATDAVLPQYREMLDPENRWTLFSTSEYGIIYNTNMLTPEELPTSYEDMCDERFRGQMSFDPLTIRYLYGLYVMMGDEGLQEWLQCISENEPIIQRGHTQRLEFMLAGDHAISPHNYFYSGASMKAQNPEVPFGIVEGVPVLLYGQANVINRNTSNPYSAALFADWHLSEEWQTYLAERPRGPVTVDSPYIPADAELVIYSYGTSEEYEKISDYWDRYMR